MWEQEKLHAIHHANLVFGGCGVGENKTFIFMLLADVATAGETFKWKTLQTAFASLKEAEDIPDCICQPAGRHQPYLIADIRAVLVWQEFLYDGQFVLQCSFQKPRHIHGFSLKWGRRRERRRERKRERGSRRRKRRVVKKWMRTKKRERDWGERRKKKRGRVTGFAAVPSTAHTPTAHLGAQSWKPHHPYNHFRLWLLHNRNFSFLVFFSFLQLNNYFKVFQVLKLWPLF